MFAKTTPPIPEESTFSVSFSQIELLYIGGCGVLMLLALVALLVYLSRKTHDQFGSVAEDFERTVLTELTSNKQPSGAMAPVPAASTPVVPPLDDSPAAPVGEGPIPALAQRLRAMGVLGAYKGAHPLGFGPEAQIYAHTGGGTILILPRMESEAFLAHAVKQHDLIVAPTSEGGALMIMALGDKMSISTARGVNPQ